jgi:hypothetical protein
VKVQHCEIAYSELVRDEIVYITKGLALYWLENKTIRKIPFFPRIRTLKSSIGYTKRLNSRRFLMID